MSDQPKNSVSRTNIFAGIPKQQPMAENKYLGNGYIQHVEPRDTEFMEGW